MNKRVYLFELDSVKTEERDIIKGQRAIINEIAKNGNCVVLTLNQLSDSLAFAELIKNERTYPHILSLFKSGALRVSLFGNKRTVSQYMQESLDKCLTMDKGTFIFSSLPIKAEDTERVNIVKNALRYSDLSEISAKIAALREEGRGEEAAEMEYILRYVNMALMLSVTETSNIPARTDSTTTLVGYMKRARGLLTETSVDLPLWRERFTEANEILDSVEGELISEALDERKMNDRSNWLDRISKRESESEGGRKIASLLVNISYNYKVEDSVFGVSKHYSDDTFEKELLSRIFYLLSEKETVGNRPTVSAWASTARIAEQNKRPDKAVKECRLYEDKLVKERFLWDLFVFGRLTRFSLIAILYILLFCLTEYVFSIFEGMASHWFEGMHIGEIATKVAVILLFGFFGSVLSGVARIPDIFQCVKSIALHIHDMVFILGGRYESYRLNK